jgi:hypothetical protein
VARTGQDPVPFEEESALFRSINEGYTEGYVEVYAPIMWNTETDKKRIRERLRAPIRQCIEAIKPSPVEEIVRHDANRFRSHLVVASVMFKERPRFRSRSISWACLQHA